MSPATAQRLPTRPEGSRPSTMEMRFSMVVFSYAKSGGGEPLAHRRPKICPARQDSSRNATPLPTANLAPHIRRNRPGT